MSDLLTALNHLLAAWLAHAAESSSGGPIRVQDVTLEANGLWARVWLEQGSWRGQAVVRLQAGQPRGNRQEIQVKVEQWPEKMPEGLKPFRRLLETARLSFDLDLDPPQSV